MPILLGIKISVVGKFVSQWIVSSVDDYYISTDYKQLLQPRRALSHKALPSARAVSMKLTSNVDQPDEKKTIALAVWSQFIYHDLVHTPVRKTSKLFSLGHFWVLHRFVTRFLFPNFF